MLDQLLAASPSAGHVAVPGQGAEEFDVGRRAVGVDLAHPLSVGAVDLRDGRNLADEAEGFLPAVLVDRLESEVNRDTGVLAADWIMGHQG